MGGLSEVLADGVRRRTCPDRITTRRRRRTRRPDLPGRKGVSMPYLIRSTRRGGFLLLDGRQPSIHILFRRLAMGRATGAMEVT